MSTKEDKDIADVLKDLLPLLTAAGDGLSHGGIAFLEQWPSLVERVTKSRHEFLSAGELQALVQKIVQRSYNSTVHYGWKWTCLMWAVYYERVDIISHLLEKGADVRVADEDGRTALHRAAFWGKIKSLETILNSPHVKKSDLSEACSMPAKSCGKNCMDLAAIAKSNSEECKTLLAPYCSLTPVSASPAGDATTCEKTAVAADSSGSKTTSKAAGKPVKDKAATAPAVASTSTASSSEVTAAAPMSEETKQALHAFQSGMLAKLKVVRSAFAKEMDELRKENAALKSIISQGK